MSRQLGRNYASALTRQVSAAEMLRLAADQFGGGGAKKWIKGDFHDDGGGSCALGAIENAMAGRCIMSDDFEAAETALLKTLKDMHPELQANNIPDLNDDPAVTFADILAAFEKTALMFEERVSGE